jgi:serine/threonine-protein kinase HipA
MQRESVALEQQYRRMVFNVIGRNQDDHTKNISFLMDRAGHWSLSPAYDITYSYNASGEWTSRHQMSVNGKRDHFTLEDLLQSATAANIKRPKAMKIVCQVSKIISRWPDFAKKAGVPDRWIQDISQHHRKLI